MSYLPPMLAKYLMTTRLYFNNDQDIRRQHLEHMASKGYASKGENGDSTPDLAKIHNDFDGFSAANLEFAKNAGTTPEDLYGDSMRQEKWLQNTKKILSRYPDFLKFIPDADRANMFTMAIHADHDADFQDRYAETVEKYMGENGHSRALRWRAGENRRAAEGRPTHFDLGFEANLPDESPEGMVTFRHPHPDVEAQINRPDRNMDHEQIIMTFAPEYMENYYKRKGITDESQSDTPNV